ncbi:MAG: 50S ribosomal protein L10 [Bacillota bacterium]|nr:50S ribosomal protein L10 [Bacillota bacterium]
MNSKVIERKKQIVQEIKEKIENSKSVVLVDYRGLDVAEVSELRKKYREAGVDYKVYKNTMMRFAFKEAGYEDFIENLTGPNGVAFSIEDAIGAAKISDEFSKKNEKLKIKAGIVDGNIIGIDQIKELANIPSREVLIAKLLGSLNSPITGFVNVLQGNMRNLVYALDAIKDQKEQN